MALHAAFSELDRRLADFEQSLEMLQWAVVQAKPEQGHALLDHYEALSLDLMGMTHEARDAVSGGLRATEGAVDPVATRVALATVNRRYNKVWARLFADAGSIDSVQHLNDLRRSGTAWRRWANGVSDALGQCPSCLFDVGQALTGCWEDLFEGVSMPPLAMHLVGSGKPTALTGRIESE